MPIAIFGTDGVRGIFGQGALTSSGIYLLALAALRELSTSGNKDVVIGEDTRCLSPIIRHILISSLIAGGARIRYVGVVPTAAVGLYTQHTQASFGLMITASHNSYEFNGIKIFCCKGMKISVEQEQAIEKHLLTLANADYVCRYAERGEFIDNKAQCQEVYFNNIKSFYNAAPCNDISKKISRKIIVDCSNGATHQFIHELSALVPFALVIIHDKPTGLNINRDCGSCHLGKLQELVKNTNDCVLGIAFDGDGDRLVAVNSRGGVVEQDALIAALIDFYYKNKLLKNNICTLTNTSNTGLIEFCNERGIECKIVDVGDRNITDSIIRHDMSFGAEQSGHIINLNNNLYTSDGISMLVNIIEIMQNNHAQFLDNIDFISLYNAHSGIANNVSFNLNNNPSFDEFLNTERNKITNSRIIVRKSGTQPIIRVLCESKSDLQHIIGVVDNIINYIDSAPRQ